MTDDEADLDDVVHGLDDLLMACDCVDLEELGLLIDDTIDEHLDLWGAGSPHASAHGDITLHEPHLGRAIGLAFPFAVGDLFDAAFDLRDEYRIEVSLLDLAAEIEAVEQIAVELELDPDVHNLPSRVGRRITRSGVLVQTIRPYGHTTPTSGDVTIGEWFDQRVSSVNPGLRIVDGGRVDDTLANARTRC